MTQINLSFWKIALAVATGYFIGDLAVVVFYAIIA